MWPQMITTPAPATLVEKTGDIPDDIFTKCRELQIVKCSHGCYQCTLQIFPQVIQLYAVCKATSHGFVYTLLVCFLPRLAYLGNLFILEKAYV